MTTTPTKSPDSQNHTSPHHVQPINPLSFTNVPLNDHLKNHHHHLHEPPPPPMVVTYKNCLKNHAASIGGHAVDGCGEFMPSSSTSLICDACGCHRNFHRRESDNFCSSPTPISINTPTTTHFINFQSRMFSPSPSPPPAYARDHHRLPSPVTPTAGKGQNSRKRFRTKFTQHQKEKMMCFAEKLKWKMPKSEGSVRVENFCNEVGVSRGVLKVWMHNNKHTIRKKYSNNNNLNINNNGIENVGIITFQNNGINDVDNNNLENSNNDGVHLHVSANGSSPSSS